MRDPLLADPPAGNGSALEMAWRRWYELYGAARRAEGRHLALRLGFIANVFLAVLLAALAELGWAREDPLAQAALQGLLLVALIVGLVLLAFASRSGEREIWGLLRSAAAEIEKEIFLYATILQDHDQRDQWLFDRVSRIRRRVSEHLGSEMTKTAEVEKRIPTFDRLLGNEYLEQRVEHQLAKQLAKTRKLRAYRRWIQILVFASLGVGTLLIAQQDSSRVLVVLTLALALALLAWSEMRRLDAEADRGDELTTALHLVQDYWRGVAPEERTAARFFRLVTITEQILWSRQDDAVPAIRRAVAELRGTSEDLLEQVLKMPPPARIEDDLRRRTGRRDEPEEEPPPPPASRYPSGVWTETVVEPLASAPVARAGEPRALRGLPHAFVVMPFGRKQAADGTWIDFDRIYRQLIRPALREAGFDPFRADEETVSGDILTDMFQELLLADLVIADLSIDNANVFYELGVRHAMRRRGLIHIQAGRTTMPFDVFSVRTLAYHCDPTGKPDPKLLARDRQAIVKAARETWASDRNRVHSPIFNLLDGLPEPDRRALRTPLATGYWREHTAWQERMAIARRRKRIGDLLLLTEEVRNPLIQEEAIAEAGRALRAMGLHVLALQQYRRGLEVNPHNVEFRREEAVHLGRLGRYDEAIVKLDGMLRDDPTDIEALFVLGELYEELWKGEIEEDRDRERRIREASEAGHWLKQAIEKLLAAYRLDQNHAWSGIKALTLAEVLDHVTERAGADNDPEVHAIRQELPALRGAVGFTVTSGRGENSFSDLILRGYLSVVLAEDPRVVSRAYKKALTLGGRSKYYLQFTLDRLRFLASLDFRAEQVGAAVAVLEDALRKLAEQERENGRARRDRRQVFLFAGHRLDPPDAPQHRFPAAMENEARQRIEKTLDHLGADADDLAIAAGAACGGEILFAESCLRRGMHLEVHLPVEEAAFIQESVAYAGDDWVERFYQLRNHPEVRFKVQEDRIGEVPEGENAEQRNNVWALYSALVHGIDRIRLVVLWDGDASDDAVGTGHMVRQVRGLGGIVEHLDTRRFDYWQAQGKVGRALDLLAEGL